MKAALLVALLAALGCSRREPWPDAAPSAPVSFSTAPRAAAQASVKSAAPERNDARSQPVRKKLTPAETFAELGIPEGQFYVPEVTGSELRPLLVVLHGLGASGKSAFEALRLRELGQKERVYVVAPDGRVDSKGRRFWNAHPACCDFDQTGVDDVGRLTRLIGDIATTFAIDKGRLYVLGFSNGGFMAQKLACSYGRALAAVASIAAAHPLDEACDLGKLPLAVLEVHGDADDVVSYQGGTVFQRPGAPTHGSAAETLSYWGKKLECRGEPRPGPSLDLDPRLPGEETIARRYERCRGGTAELWTVRGGGHLIGTRPPFVEQAWRFLSSHRKFQDG